MRLIDDDEIIVSPVKAAQVQSVRHATITRQVGMKQHIIIQSIRSDGIIDVVILISIPVLCQLLRTENQNRFIPVFVVLHDRQCSECFTQTDAIREDAAVVLFKLIDNRKHGISLEIIEHTPDFALLESSRLVREHILRNIIQELTEDMVQGHEIDEFWRIFSINCTDVFHHHVRDILHFFTVIPQLVKQLHILLGKWSLHAVDQIVGIVTALTSEVDRGEPGHRRIRCLCIFRIDSHKTHHVFARRVRLKSCFPANPVCAFLRNRTLSHLVAKLNLKLCTVQAGFSGKTRDIKLALLLLSFFLNKSW